MISGLVAVSVLLGCRSASDTLDSSPVLVPVVLPDLSRMHELVQEQFREAHASLVSLESVGEAGPDARSEAYGEMGSLFMEGEYLGLAERCYRNAQLLAPDDFRWPYYLGHLFKKKGDLREAAEHFERALRVRPADFAALMWLIDVYIHLGQPEPAEALLTKARSLYPGTPAVLFQLGKAALATQDYASAVEYLEGALRLNPEATVLHYRLAMAYRGLGDLENAQHHLDRQGDVMVILLDPLMVEVNTMLRTAQVPLDRGLEATENEDWPEAVTQFRTAVAMAPDNAVIRLSLGLALNLMGEARAALDEFEEAVRLDPQFASAHYNMGTLFERSGLDQEAIDYYTVAVTQDPNLGKAHLGLANSLHRTGRFEASLSHYQLVIDRPEARFGEAIALVRLGRHREARERLRVAIDLHPDQPLFANALARLLATSSDDQVRDGRRAFELVDVLVKEQQTTAVAETMAMALAELGQFMEAAEWQRLAISVATEAGRPDIAEQMSANLTLYERREPCRTPWRDDDPEYKPGPVVEPGLLDTPPSS